MSDPIRIGTFWPFTGPPGVQVNAAHLQAGTATAIAAFNERGGLRGRPVHLLVEDSGYDTEMTARAARKLIDEDGVVALLNANGTPQITALLPYLGASGIPLLLPFGGADEWYDPPRGWILGLNAPFNDIGVLLGRWAADDGCRSIAVLYPDYPPTSTTMAQRVARGFEEAGGDGAHLVRVTLGSRDGTGMADAIEEIAPDAVVILTNRPELEVLTGELHRRRRPLPLYSWSSNVTESTAAELGALIEGMKGHAQILADPAADLPLVQHYRALMARDSPDLRLDTRSLQAFAHTSVFTEALSRIPGEVTEQTIVEAFLSLDGYDTGILGPVSFTADKPIGITTVQPMQLRDGHWVTCAEPQCLPSQEKHP